jgi:hypothetical protein
MSSVRIAMMGTALAGLAVIATGVDAQNLMVALPPSTVRVDPSPDCAIQPLEIGPQTSDMVAGADPGSALAEAWTWQPLPEGVMYRSYLAGAREARFASQWIHERDHGALWDITLGGRAGILRYGTEDPFWPEGYQLDIEGAAFPRLSLDEERDLVSVDFRFGIPLTFRRGPWETKFGYYHLSSHLGDEFWLRHPETQRINYVRESLLAGIAFRPHPDLRLYGETGYAFYVDGGAEPWEFQFGAEYSPAEPTDFLGAPFFAIGTHLRQENHFGGNLVVQTGWQWRGPTGRLLRVGLHYLNGKSNQYQFFHEHEEQIGFGTWFDF